MKIGQKSLRFLLAITIIISSLGFVTLAIAAQPTSSFVGIPLQEFISHVAYLCSNLDIALDTQDLVQVSPVGDLLTFEMDGFTISNYSDDDLYVVRISVAAFPISEADEVTVSRHLALIAALEYKMPESDSESEDEALSVLASALTIHDQMVEVLHSELSSLASGADVPCYHGIHYDYHWSYQNDEVILLATVNE